MSGFVKQGFKRLSVENVMTSRITSLSTAWYVLESPLPPMALMTASAFPMAAAKELQTGQHPSLTFGTLSEGIAAMAPYSSSA